METKVILANPGCGKSHSIEQLMSELITSGNRGIFISYNKANGEKTKKRKPMCRDSVYTLHKLAYIDCCSSSFIGDVFDDLKMPKIKKMIREKFGTERLDRVLRNPEELMSLIGDIDGKLDELGKAILKILPQIWLTYAEETRFKNLDFIIVDEFQDVPEDLLPMVFKLAEINKDRLTELIFAGDERQDIYAQMHKRKPGGTIKTIKKKFRNLTIETLNTSYRLSPSIQRFTNAFYVAQYAGENLYDLPKYPLKMFTDDVFIHSVQNWWAVSNEVEGIVSQYPDGKILIVGRTNYELEWFRERYKDNDNITVSTIHAAKGDERDIVIIINRMFSDKLSSIDNKNIWNVAITRAAHKLHIVSSFPLQSLEEKFGDSGTYSLINTQRKFQPAYSKLSEHNPSPLNLEAISKSLIDSVNFRIDFERCPFVPFEVQNIKPTSSDRGVDGSEDSDIDDWSGDSASGIEDQSGRGRTNQTYITQTAKKHHDIEFVVTRHNGKYLTFSFHDLNPLKRKMMTDNEILIFLIDAIRAYFDYQISESEINDILITRLDLCRSTRVTSTGILSVMEDFFYLSKYTKAESKIRRIGDENSQTLYLNAREVRGVGKRVIRAYFPTNKKKNRLEEQGAVLKLEIERHRLNNCAQNGNLTMTVKELMAHAENNTLSDVFNTWLQYEFPCLSGSSPASQRRFSACTQEEIKREIYTTKDSRRKKALFTPLLGTLSAHDSQALRFLFGLSQNPYEPASVSKKTSKATRSSVDSTQAFEAEAEIESNSKKAPSVRIKRDKRKLVIKETLINVAKSETSAKRRGMSCPKKQPDVPKFPRLVRKSVDARGFPAPSS